MGMKAIVGSVFASGVVLLVTGCTGSYTVREGGVDVYPDPIVIEPGIRRSYAQSYNIPDGHYPPPGSCRVWFPDRPAGQQPPPGSCNVRVPYGAVLIEG